ncbi:MAG: hypothetical protein FWD69_19830 [Polyangiaceae bacterium]|nr:hypothetical protein [Polyangiaceae bacterium]
MRTSVANAFVPFTVPLEWVVPWMYLDIKGLVTVGIGNLIDGMSGNDERDLVPALVLPFVRSDGSPATSTEIASAWRAVKSHKELAKQGYKAAEKFTSIRLTDDGIRQVVLGKLAQNDKALSARYTDWASWPADAQLGVLSMAWAMGPAFKFPRFDAAVRSLDFIGAASECTINESGNPGVKPRNVRNRVLFRNAARVISERLDPDTLYWPTDLSAAA